MAPVPQTDLELRFLLFFRNLGRCRHSWSLSSFVLRPWSVARPQPRTAKVQGLWS